MDILSNSYNKESSHEPYTNKWNKEQKKKKKTEYKCWFK